MIETTINGEAQIRSLREQGYVIVRQFLTGTALTDLKRRAHSELAAAREPLEYEADLKYPGAPESRHAHGGGTVRRLLDAYGRDPLFAACATSPQIKHWMEGYFQEPTLMARAHHNCLMTKHPRFGSQTDWHRDIRYWSFERADLVSVWIALGEEVVDNGALWVIPGSHKIAIGAERFDPKRFFRTDAPENDVLLQTKVAAELSTGDALFFHCNTLHSAGRNTLTEVKLSLVFTYHGASNHPLSGTRSASVPAVRLA